MVIDGRWNTVKMDIFPINLKEEYKCSHDPSGYYMPPDRVILKFISKVNNKEELTNYWRRRRIMWCIPCRKGLVN